MHNFYGVVNIPDDITDYYSGTILITCRIILITGDAIGELYCVVNNINNHIYCMIIVIICNNYIITNNCTIYDIISICYKK